MGVSTAIPTWKYFFKVIFSKILGEQLNIQDKIDLGSFSYNLVNKFNPSLLSSGNTLGNSMFSEIYAVGGFFGIFLIVKNIFFDRIIQLVI